MVSSDGVDSMQFETMSRRRGEISIPVLILRHQLRAYVEAVTPLVVVTQLLNSGEKKVVRKPTRQSSFFHRKAASTAQ
jgi:hypothetical protein